MYKYDINVETLLKNIYFGGTEFLMLISVWK